MLEPDTVNYIILSALSIYGCDVGMYHAWPASYYCCGGNEVGGLENMNEPELRRGAASSTEAQSKHTLGVCEVQGNQ